MKEKRYSSAEKWTIVRILVVFAIVVLSLVLISSVLFNGRFVAS